MHTEIMRVLATGGAGYVGSHTIVELLENGHEVHVVDDLSNSSYEALSRVEELTGKSVGFTRTNIRDEAILDRVFADFKPEAVIHFAGLKAVGESVEQPLRYYLENVGGSVALFRVMDRHACRTIVFSSSATVYGMASEPPFTEDAPLQATNPYGQTKAMIEQILQDLAVAGSWRIALLRYFNPVGAHPSGRIGEDPADIPNNLFPYVAQVASGRLDALRVFGDDYPTPDGTGVRDYIHVCDLAQGHQAALDALADREGCFVWNLGTGVGASVLEVLAAWSAAVGRELPYQIVARRDGDVAVSLADPSKARRDLGWEGRRTLQQMCEDHWAWQSANPNGY